jgi:hypothetical protein
MCLLTDQINKNMENKQIKIRLKEDAAPPHSGENLQGPQLRRTARFPQRRARPGGPATFGR